MEGKLTALEVIKKIIEMSRDFKSGKVDTRLYESVKASTGSMVENNPSLDIDYFLDSLYTSTLISANRMLSENAFDDTVEMMINLGKEYAKAIDNPEDEINLIEGLKSKIVRFFLKKEIIEGMLSNSVELSRKAIYDSFESRAN